MRQRAESVAVGKEVFLCKTLHWSTSAGGVVRLPSVLHLREAHESCDMSQRAANQWLWANRSRAQRGKE
jgi:hypothetical protein